MSPKPDVSEERKEQIIEAATRVFLERGVQKTRMDDIVEKSGLSKGALYWYFKSKDDLIIGIVDALFEKEFKTLQDFDYNEGSAKEVLNEFVEIMIADFGRISVLMPIFFEFFALAMRSKTIRNMFKQYFHKYMSYLEPIIQRGIDSGEFRQINAYDAAINLGALLEGTFLLKAYDPDMVELEKHFRSGLEVFLHGIEA
ncbi:MAG: TetR/AcrR family transcriptional regulator [Anaerolineales bacterium]|nr:TetR/AcrR family transcriptional regulator [Anaerolineales bacterium]